MPGGLLEALGRTRSTEGSQEIDRAVLHIAEQQRQLVAVHAGAPRLQPERDGIHFDPDA